MDFHSMKRRQLQDLCKKHNLPANKTNLQMAESLSLIFKDETKSVGSSREVVSENSSGVVAKRAKKVRFCLEERKIEITDLGSDSDDRVQGVTKETRRKSILKPQPEIPIPSSAATGNLDEEEGKGDIPVRVTRSRVRKSMVLEEPLGRRKKSRVGKNSTESVCGSDKARSGSSLSGDGVSDDTVVLENDVVVRRSLRSRSIEDFCPERIDIRSTRTREKTDSDVGKENIVPMTRSLRSRKIEVVPEKTDTNPVGKTKRGIVSEERKNMEEFVEDVGIVAKKLVKKRSNKTDNGDAVEKRKTPGDKTELCVTGQEEIGNTLETGEAVKQLNMVSSRKQFLTKTELVAGAEISEKPSVQLDELIGESSHESNSTALVSDSEYEAKVEGSKKKSNYQEPRRRSQRIAPKSISFAPNVEHESENVVQPEEEDGQALLFEDPRNCNAPQPSHEMSSLVSKYQNITQSKRKMLTESKGLPRRSRRKTYINKSISRNDDSDGQNKVGKKVEEPLLEVEDSLPDALVAEDSRSNKSQNIVHNDETSPINHLINADEDKQGNQGHCDDVVLMEKEPTVTVVGNLSLPSVSDQLKEIKNHAIPLVKEIINGNCGEEASMMPNESQESTEIGEISDNHDTCSIDTTLIKPEDYVSTNLEDKATTNENFACENDIGFVEEGDMETLEKSVEDDNVECGASPIIDVAHDVSDERAIEGEQLLDETITNLALSCERGRSRDERHAMKSKHFSSVVANGNDVESGRHTPESVRQLVFQDEADEEVPQMIQSGRMGIQQSGHHGNVQYGKISVNELEAGTNFCVTDGDVELEDHKGFVSEGSFVECEEADGLSKSCGVSAFDIVEAHKEDGDSNEEGVLLQCCGNEVSAIVDKSEAGPVANEAIKFTLDEHEIDLQVTEDSIIVEGEAIFNAQEEKDASAKEPDEESGELAAAMGKESEFRVQNDINEDSHVGGTKSLVSLDNQMDEEEIEENCVCENIEVPAEEGKHSGAFESTCSSEMVDMDGSGRLGHAHANPISNELILEDNRTLKDNLAQIEITDCVGGTYATDCGVGTIIQPQIERVEPFQDCFSTEQSGTADDRHWNEIFSSQHTEPRHRWSAIDDQNDFNDRGDVADQEESVHTIDEPILDNLKMVPRNEVSYNVCEVRKHAASGTCLNTEGARHVDCIECKEIYNTSLVISQTNERTAVDEAEKHMVDLAKEVKNDAGISMGEYIAIMDENGLHRGSTHQNERENTERCDSKLENISQIAQKSEESTKPTLTELDDNMEDGVGHVDDATFSEDQDKTEDMVEYEPEPDEPAEASSVLQLPCESVLAELSIINDSGLRSTFEMHASSCSAGRNLDDHSVLGSGSIVCHHHSESQEVLSEAIANDLEDVERASDAEVSAQSVSRNFSFEGFFENVQLSETFKLETLGELSEKKGSDRIVEENEVAIEQFRESKLTELMLEEMLEAKASSAPEVKAEVQSCLNNFEEDNNEEASASLTAKYCTEYSKGRDTIEDEDNRDINKIEPTSPFTSHVDELSIIKDAENEDMSSRTLEVADYEDYDGKVHDGMAVTVTQKEPPSAYAKITEKNSNAMVEENCIFMDSRIFLLEEETSSSPTEISSGAHKLLGSNEVHMKADLDKPSCNFDASENFGDQEYASQVFENHCTNEDLNTEQYSRANDSEHAVLGDAIFEYSGAEIKERAVDFEELIETENISESSLESFKASGGSIRTSPCEAESGFQSEVVCNKDDSRMRKSFVSFINVADGGGDDLELLQDCTGNADFPHLQVDQAEDQELLSSPEVGTNEACNANSTDRESDNNATVFRSPLAVEKEESNGSTPGSVVKEEVKVVMDDINSQLRKMHISSTIKWRGRASMNPKECKKSFEEHDQLASDMKENITSMKCVKSGNSEKQSGFKRRALKDLQGSQRRDQSCYTPYKQQ